MRFKNTAIAVLITLCILFSITYVAAIDAHDTDMISNVNEKEVSIDNDDQEITILSDSANDDDGTFTSLQSKINQASEGSTINLTRDYCYDEGFKSSGIFINKDITINGNGHTLDGMSKSRIFNINFGDIFGYNKVTLNNIKFKNGNAKIYGGAILNFADLTVKGCTFTNNYAGTAGGAINSLGALTLKNSVFKKNSAGGDAGAVFSLTIKKGYEFYSDYFKDINATDDPKLILTIAAQALLEPGKDTIYNCVFTKNVANGRGGGAVYAFSHINIKSCTFNSNKAGEKGAAVYGCKDLYIKNSKFNRNKVGMYGGAVYFKCHEQTGSYVNGTWVPSVKFYSNLIKGSTFSNNAASKRGGAIYGFRVSDSDKVHCAKAVKCVFSNNKAPKGNEIYGGTLKKCTIKNIKITLNTVNVKKSAKKLVLTSTLKKDSSAMKNKKITFKFNGKTFKAKTNSKGIAKVTVKSNILKKLKVGKTVAYSASYDGFSVKKTAKVYR